MERPDIRREGDDFLFTWQSGLEAEVRDLHQSRDGPRAEVRFSSKLADVGHLHQAMLNLMSSSSRDSARRVLERRDPMTDWQAAIEQVCVLSVKLWRESEPFIRIVPQLRDEAAAYLVRPLLPTKIATLLFGDGAVGKSLLAQMLAAALSRGEGLAGMWAAGPLRVGYADWETDDEEFADRMARLGIDGEDVWYKRLWAPLYDVQRQIKREADAFGLEVMIYDSLGFAAGGELTESDTVLRCFSAIRYIGRPGLLIHHIPKEKKEPYGSVYVRNAARNVWYLSKAHEHEDGFSAALVHRKSNRSRIMDAIGLRFHFGPERTWLERADARPLLLETGEGKIAERIIALLAESEQAYTPQEIAAGLGYENSDLIRKPLQRLLERHSVECTSTGAYKLPP